MHYDSAFRNKGIQIYLLSIEIKIVLNFICRREHKYKSINWEKWIHEFYRQNT